MRVEHLEYFQAVARLGSLRRAAEELHLSQPALSEAMRGLERELGVALLDRHRSGTRVNVTGQELLPDVVAALEAVDRLRRAADDQHRSNRLVRVGTVNTATFAWVIPAIGAFSRQYPGTHVELVCATHDEIERMLLEGGLDFGLVNQLEGDESPARLEVLDLLRGTAVMCLRADSDLAAGEAVTLEEVAAGPLVMMRSGYAMHRLLRQLLPDRLPEATCSADGAEMGKLMVAEGLGMSLLPDFSIDGDPLERSGVITWRPIEGVRPSVTLGLMRRCVGSPSRVSQEFFDVLVGSRPR